MNYIENFVVDAVGDVLKELYIGIRVSEEYTSTSKQFPLVTIVQADSSDHMRSHTAQGERATNLMFEITVYSNVTGTKRLQAYEIMETIDGVMTGRTVTQGRQLGFRRTMCSPIPNLQDSTIYALKARYQGVDMPEYHDDEIIHRIYTN